VKKARRRGQRKKKHPGYDYMYDGKYKSSQGKIRMLRRIYHANQVIRENLQKLCQCSKSYPEKKRFVEGQSVSLCSFCGAPTKRNNQNKEE